MNPREKIQAYVGLTGQADAGLGLITWSLYKNYQNSFEQVAQPGEPDYWFVGHKWVSSRLPGPTSLGQRGQIDRFPDKAAIYHKLIILWLDEGSRSYDYPQKLCSEICRVCIILPCKSGWHETSPMLQVTHSLASDPLGRVASLCAVSVFQVSFWRYIWWSYS